MRINSINPQTQTAKYTNFSENNNTIDVQNNNNTLPMPSSQHYIGYNPNFCGGYSLNLAETVKNLDKLAEKHPDIYPKNIREWAEMILEEGNQGKETLINIHKKLYENIKECFSLKELKEKFPEFENVKAVEDVEYREGTLLDDLTKGKLEFFNTEEELPLQIIKLYWGEGFSLNDLKTYTNGKDLNHVMDKLNIPKVNQHYGHVLKFSDPEYNERLTKQMAQKRMETLDIRAQKSDGEPVYIKRGPLSAEHRQHISEGLLKHYQEHPEKIFAMSERQKKFYEDNPEQAKILHRVMVKAWNVFGADRIKQALSKFMKGKGFKNFVESELDSPNKISQEKSKAMKQFWGINEWAKKSFSKNMEYAWKKVKEEQEMFYKVELTPALFKKRLFAWLEKQGVNPDDLGIDSLKYYPHKPEQNNLDASNISRYTSRYILECKGDESQKIALTYQTTLLKMGKILKGLEKSKESKDTKENAQFLRALIHCNLFDTFNSNNGLPALKTLKTNEVQKIYSQVMTNLMNNHEHKLLKQLYNLLDESYIHIDKTWEPGKPFLISPDATNF